MANAQSAHIVKITSSPKNISKHGIGDGQADVYASGTFEWTPATGGTLELMRLPANAIVDSIEIAHDDMATTSITVDVGLYQNGSGTAAGTAIDLDCFADGVDFDGAAGFTELRYTTNGIQNCGKRLHEAVTLLTAAEALEYGTVTLVLTCAAATAGIAGTISWRVRYTV